MSRGMTAAMETAAQSGDAKVAYIVKIDTDGGEVRVWTGIGDLTFQSQVYTGVGTLGSISDVSESTDLSANGIRLTLSGIPTSIISTAFNDVRQGREVSVWFAMLDIATNAIIADPELIFSGETDAVFINEGAETSTVSVNAEHRLIRLEKKNPRRYTDQDQKQRFPTDRGFEHVAGLQDRELTWGRKATPKTRDTRTHFAKNT